MRRREGGGGKREREGEKDSNERLLTDSLNMKLNKKPNNHNKQKKVEGRVVKKKNSRYGNTPETSSMRSHLPV